MPFYLCGILEKPDLLCGDTVLINGCLRPGVEARETDRQSGGKVLFSLVAPHGLLDLSFQTRDQICAPCSGKAKDIQKFCILMVLAGIQVYTFVKPYQTVHLE